MEVNQMNRQRINTISFRFQIAIFAIVSLLLSSTIASAHGGEEHVTGTVTKISDNSVTVKTTAGKIVEIGFDAKTTFARAKQPIQKTDIKAGDRIVIHAAEVSGKLVAHTVEIGTAPAAKTAKSRTGEVSTRRPVKPAISFYNRRG
jgi:hypothetical protein